MFSYAALMTQPGLYHYSNGIHSRIISWHCMGVRVQGHQQLTLTDQMSQPQETYRTCCVLARGPKPSETQQASEQPAGQSTPAASCYRFNLSKTKRCRMTSIGEKTARVEVTESQPDQPGMPRVMRCERKSISSAELPPEGMSTARVKLRSEGMHHTYVRVWRLSRFAYSLANYVACAKLRPPVVQSSCNTTRLVHRCRCRQMTTSYLVRL